MQPSMFEPSAYLGLQGRYSKAQESIRDMRKKEVGLHVSIWRAAKIGPTYMPTLNGCTSKNSFFIMLRYLKFGVLGYSS